MGPGHVNSEGVLPIEGLYADAAKVDEPPREVDGLDVHLDTVLLLVGFATSLAYKFSSH